MSTTLQFKKAVKCEKLLRLSISGPSGSGKTYTALAVAKGLAALYKKRVAVIDTENGSASLYSDIFDFDVLEIEAPYQPDKYIAAIKAAEDSGAGILIIDSLSHAWNGPGGLLEEKDKLSKLKGYNDFTAWGPVDRLQRKLIAAITHSKIHVLVCMRSKTKYMMEEYTTRGGQKGSRPKKVGMGAIQKDGIEYEFDVSLEMDLENDAVIEKTRFKELMGQVINKPGKELAVTIFDCLQGEPAPIPKTVEEKKEDNRKFAIQQINEAASKFKRGDDWVCGRLIDLGIEDISFITTKVFKIIMEELREITPDQVEAVLANKAKPKTEPKAKPKTEPKAKLVAPDWLKQTVDEVNTRRLDSDPVTRNHMYALVQYADELGDAGKLIAKEILGILEKRQTWQKRTFLATLTRMSTFSKA